jgi:hypothetical protein
MSPNDAIHYQIYTLNFDRYIATLPLRRRILAMFFEKYKVTKKEYDEWFYATYTK